MTTICFGRATAADVREMPPEEAHSLFADGKGDLFYYALDVSCSSHVVLVDSQGSAVVLDADFIDTAAQALLAAKQALAIKHIQEGFQG